MSPAAHAWLLIGATALLLAVFYLVVRDARKRAGLRPPVVIRRSRTEPLYGWDFAGAGYVVALAAAHVDSSRIAPELAPFWRSDEPQRLQWLINDERFARWLRELRTVPDFAALVVADSNDARIPIGSPLRKVPRGGDVIGLSRKGEEVPFRDERDVEEDVARLTKLRDLLASMPLPETLEHAAAPGFAQTAMMRVLRSIILFALIVGGMWLLGTILWRHC